VHDADERHVVHLVRHVLLPGDRGLELARQVGELRVADVAVDDRVDRGLRVEHLVGADARDGGAEDDARGVAARLGGDHPEALEPLPDRRHALDLDPVVLDVLPVGDVGGVAPVPPADLPQRAELLGGERAAVEAHAQHEVAVVELLGLQRRGAPAVDPGPALGVEAPPAHPAAQVGGVDRVEPALAVDVLDARADVEPVVVALGALVRVQRLAVAELPLAFAALALAGRSAADVPGQGWGALRGLRVPGRASVAGRRRADRFGRDRLGRR
jgi:hypothetical protein